MPTYEFRCSNGHVFDEFHKINDAPSTAVCPQCGAVGERAISGGAGLVFKGSGFYLTDYGKNAHRGGAAPAAGGDAKGGDAKPAGDGGGAAKSESSGSGGAPAAPASGGTSGGASTGGTSSGTSSKSGE